MRASIKPVLRAVAEMQKQEMTALDLACLIEVEDSAAYSYIRDMAKLKLVEPCGTVDVPRGPKPIIWRWIRPK